MNKDFVSSLLKTILFGIIWTAIGFVIATLLVKSKGYYLNDILFIEGLILIVISVLSAIGGNPTGLSISNTSMTSSISAYTNLEITKSEREKNLMKQTLLFGLSSLSLIIGGILLIIINFII